MVNILQQYLFAISNIVLVVLSGVAGILLHTVCEYRKKHRAALVYGPLLITIVIGFGVWIIYFLLYQMD